MTLVLGLDISTRRLTGAVIPLDPESTWPELTLSEETLPPTADRHTYWLAVRRAVGHVCNTGPALGEITVCWVEEPMGHHPVPILTGLWGAIMASIPTHIARASVRPSEWRAAYGIHGRRAECKAEAIRLAGELLGSRLSDDQAEAFLLARYARDACHGWLRTSEATA